MTHALRIVLSRIALASLLVALTGLVPATSATADPTSTNVAVLVEGLSGVTQVAAGGRSTCAVLQNGTVACWGDAANQATAPQVVPGLTDVVRVSTNANTTCAVKTDGTVWCWGQGPLGRGNTIYDTSPTPVQAVGLTGASDVSVGAGGVVCALRTDGSVWCWGDGRFGALNDGNGGYGYSASTARPVLGLSDAVTVSTGHQHVCAIRRTQELVCWGHEFGTRNKPPQTVGRLTGPFRQVSATTASTCAVDVTGKAWCFGDNAYAELGRPAAYEGPLIPIAGPAAVKEISINLEHSCLVDTSGGVWCAGRTDDGRAGPGPGPTPLPGVVAGPSAMPPLPAPATSITTGLQHTCALLIDGRVACWGDDSRGQVGNGAGILPWLVASPPATPTPPGTVAPVRPTSTITPQVDPVPPARRTQRHLFLSDLSLRATSAGQCPQSVKLTIRRTTRPSARMQRTLSVDRAVDGTCSLTARITLPKRLRAKSLTLVVEGAGVRRLVRRVR